MPLNKWSSKINGKSVIHSVQNRSEPMGLRDVQSAPSRPRGSLWKKHTGSVLKDTRVRSAMNHNESNGLTEEDANRRKYWEKFAKTATKDLFEEIKSSEEKAIQEELVFSGRVGIVPKYAPSQSDEESLDTNLSLLTCSQADVAQRLPKQKQRRSRKKTVITEEKTNWEELAKQKHGLLDKMMRQDMDMLHATQLNSVVNRRRRASEMMNDQEYNLLRECAYFRGIASEDKSYSTENVITGGDIKRMPSSKGRLRFNKPVNISGNTTPGSLVEQPIPTGRTPSPRSVVAKLTKLTRSNSLPCRTEDNLDDTPGADHKLVQQPISPFHSYDPGVISVLAGMRNGNGRGFNYNDTFKTKIQSQITKTISALERHTGYGDPTNEINSIPEEKGIYTSTDYGRIPRYPQNIRIAPQLMRVIGDTMRQHIRKPRQHKLSTKDVSQFDTTQPPVDKSHRNLLIYHWLNSIYEEDFTVHEPDILCETDADYPSNDFEKTMATTIIGDPEMTEIIYTELGNNMNSMRQDSINTGNQNIYHSGEEGHLCQEDYDSCFSASCTMCTGTEDSEMVSI